MRIISFELVRLVVMTMFALKDVRASVVPVAITLFLKTNAKSVSAGCIDRWTAGLLLCRTVQSGSRAALGSTNGGVKR